MDWSWAVAGVTNEIPRTTGPECEDYLTNRRRWLEALLVSFACLWIIHKTSKRLQPICLPTAQELNRPHSAVRLMLLLIMTFIFGVEMGFKFANKSVIFVLNPCHIQTIVQIYLLAAKPSKTTIALFRIQMNNLNGPLLAFLFPEVECRTMPFEQAAYWLQHGMLYIIPIYIIRSGAYEVEHIYDFNWVTIGIMIMLLYHFVVLNAVSIFSGINLNHMLCAAITDPFQGQNYRIAAVIHESILCPILNKVTVLIFSNNHYKNSSLKNQNYFTAKSFLQHYTNTKQNSTINNDNNTSNTESDKLLYHQHQKLTTTTTAATSLQFTSSHPPANGSEGNCANRRNVYNKNCTQFLRDSNKEESKYQGSDGADSDHKNQHTLCERILHNEECENLVDASITAAYTITTTTKID